MNSSANLAGPKHISNGFGKLNPSLMIARLKVVMIQRHPKHLGGGIQVENSMLSQNREEIIKMPI